MMPFHHSSNPQDGWLHRAEIYKRLAFPLDKKGFLDRTNVKDRMALVDLHKKTHTLRYHKNIRTFFFPISFRSSLDVDCFLYS